MVRGEEREEEAARDREAVEAMRGSARELGEMLRAGISRGFSGFREEEPVGLLRSERAEALAGEKEEVRPNAVSASSLGLREAEAAAASTQSQGD